MNRANFFLFSDMVFSALLEEGPSQGGTALKHAAGRLDRIIGDRLNGNLSLVHQGEQDLSPRLESDLLPDLSGNNDLALGQGFNDWHMGSPQEIDV
jgi:hypothetical protein